MRNLVVIFLLAFFVSCSNKSTIVFKTIDTDFSKGRLNHKQTIELADLVKFHGHLCDGLVLGSLALQQGFSVLYPDGVIDRTNTRIVSIASPCITDVAVYLSGGRYQFNTFYVDKKSKAIFIVQRIDTKQAVLVNLKQNLIPHEIDSMGSLAVRQKLSACGLDSLKTLEENFSKKLLKMNRDSLFKVTVVDTFNWNPVLRNDFIKTDVINKLMHNCY